MGNCQAIDAAALVIQHPSGRLERLYWPIPVSEVMRMNPGHYVSLIIPLPVSQEEEANHHQDRDTVRFTRVKLLRPTDTLSLGHAYRLITSQGLLHFLYLQDCLSFILISQLSLVSCPHHQPSMALTYLSYMFSSQLSNL